MHDDITAFVRFVNQLKLSFCFQWNWIYSENNHKRTEQLYWNKPFIWSSALNYTKMYVHGTKKIKEKQMKQNTILRLSKTRYPCCWVRISNLSSKYISIDEQFCYHRFLQSKSTAKQRMLHTCWERDSKETYVVKFVKRYTHLLLCSFIDARTNAHGALDVMSIQ